MAIPDGEWRPVRVDPKGTPVLIRSLIVTLAVLLMPSVAQAAGKVSFQSRSEQQVVTLLNEIRVQNHLPALKLSAPLRNAARAHSLDMLRRGYFSHNSPEETATARIARYLRGAEISENIGWGIGLRGLAAGPRVRMDGVAGPPRRDPQPCAAAGRDRHHARHVRRQARHRARDCRFRCLGPLGRDQRCCRPTR